ncbi:terpenoid synthase [Pluteus cervinus]|uniref:Terpenoid synthase n=1 Tax=Pluteus cervinus TaxID=181527 RepID=A0ACD3AV49_9AGAR|nr:terpenoid synthase [Pluteus cervinus]
MRSLPRSYLLPDLLNVCPLKGGVNPHYKKAAAESRAWVDSFNLGIFHNNASAIIKRSSVELLACYTYPAVGYDEFRTCCDFLNLLFVVDEVSDDQSGLGARATGETFLRALRSPESSDDSVLARMTKEFRNRLSSQSKPNAIRRFLKHGESYILGVIREAELRERGEVLGVEDFQILRRENSAVRVCFDLAECMGGLDLPDEVFQDPAFSEIYFAAMDMVCWSNDVYSYNMEQAKGHTGNNIVTVLMKAYNVDLQAASNFVGIHFKDLMDRFLTSQANLRSFGPQTDAAIAAYIESIGYWVRGNLDWSFQTERYFGPAVAEVKKTRRVIVRRPKPSPPLSPERERVIITSRM